MIELRFSIYYKKFKSEYLKVKLEEGLHIVYGESGSGKSAFIKFISNYGLDLKKVNYVITDIHHPGKVYIIFQNPDQQIIGRTLISELAFSSECSGINPDKIEKIVADGLKMLPYSFDPNRNPAFLSGGEKEILNLITTMQTNADVILIDDGLSFLSENNKKEFVDLLKYWSNKEDKIIVWFTSNWSDLGYSESRWKLDLASFEKVNTLEKKDYNKIFISPGELSLHVDQVTFSYNDRDIFNNFNISLMKCRFLGILGNNGSGKTTLAGLINGHLKPSSGTIKIEINGSSDITTGYLDQFPENLIRLNTPAELMEGLIENGIFDPAISKTFYKQLLRFQILWDQIADQKGIELTWVILRTMLLVLMAHCNYDLLILDEPTFGLGHEQKKTLRSFLKECMDTKHLFIVSHDQNFVQSICDQIIFMDEKKHIYNENINLERI
tara:strand:- start:400 stop:1719 length:1320 start_codon:yes stop_codon:yes gene_type:complete